MSVLSSDWTCEHLIRSPRKPVQIVNTINTVAEVARQKDFQIIEPLSGKMTQMEIARHTGLSKNRVFTICKMFGIKCNIKRKFRPQEGGRL